jgi:hypothetical protein
VLSFYGETMPRSTSEGHGDCRKVPGAKPVKATSEILARERIPSRITFLERLRHLEIS